MNLQCSDTLTHHDRKRHIPIYFEVEESAKQLCISFSYSPVEIAAALPINEISLSLFGPNGARGARHNNRNMDIRLSETFATPGYVAGKLEPGQWCLVIDAHRILPGSIVSYKISIETQNEESSEQQNSFIKGHTASRGAGWYKGDFHAHSLHSDASWDIPDLLSFAKEQKLDFVTLSDHNTVSGLSEFHSYATNELLTLGALELTSFYGHALALGLDEWTEWRVNPPNGPTQTIQQLAQNVENLGGLFIIAHPMSEGDPWCSGCHWGYADMMPGQAKVVEVWNSSWEGSSHNEAALQLYYSWLNQGQKLVATAGTDIHRHSPENHSLGFNCIFAQDLSATELLKAVRNGHLYLTNGPRLELGVTNSEGITYLMGDTFRGKDPVLRFSWDDCQTYSLRLIADATVLESFDPAGSGSREMKLKQNFRWLCLEVRDATGHLRALSNPVFF